MRDIRLAIRSLSRTPTLTVTALIVMALGIGATTAIFSVANAVLFRPLPFDKSEQLVQFGPVGVLEFKAYREQSQTFERLVSYAAVSKNLYDDATPERIAVIEAERALFDLLGARPIVGRTFLASDPLTVAVVSEGFWRRRYGGRPLNDWTLLLDGEPHAVVGIMPDRFQFPYRTTTTDVWVPTELPSTESRFQRIDVGIGRVRAGVSVDAAIGELRAIRQRQEALGPSDPEQQVQVTPLLEAVVGRSRTGVLTLLGAAVMVLVIACANVTNLLLTRAEARKPEVALRVALGAGRTRLFRQFLTESAVLALVASLAGVFIAFGVTRVLVAVAATQIPRTFEVGVDWTTFAFLLTVTVGTGLVFGMVPALHATRCDVAGMLNLAGHRTSRGRGSVIFTRSLVVAQIALTFILLTGAGLLLRALQAIERVPTGVTAEHVLTVRMESRGLYPDPIGAMTSARSAQGSYFNAIEERVGQIPGVHAAGLVTRLPVQSPGFTATFTIVGRPMRDAKGAHVRLRDASPGYFRALGIPLRAGRMFSEREPGILINEALARQHFPGEDPVGRTLNRGTIVGVVGDVRQSLRLPPEPEIYNALASTSYDGATLVVSAAIPPERLIALVRGAIRDVNANQSVFDVRTMQEVLAAAHGDVDLSLWLIGLFAVLAVVLSAAGIYGLLSFTVAAREQEFGIRLAVGATPRRVMGLVLTQGVLLVGAGVSVGMIAAPFLTRFLRGLLYDVTPTDPVAFTWVSIALACVAVVACMLPARRALTVDPVAMLRRE